MDTRRFNKAVRGVHAHLHLSQRQETPETDWGDARDGGGVSSILGPNLRAFVLRKSISCLNVASYGNRFPALQTLFKNSGREDRDEE